MRKNVLNPRNHIKFVSISVGAIATLMFVICVVNILLIYLYVPSTIILIIKSLLLLIITPAWLLGYYILAKQYYYNTFNGTINLFGRIWNGRIIYYAFLAIGISLFPTLYIIWWIAIMAPLVFLLGFNFVDAVGPPMYLLHLVFPLTGALWIYSKLWKRYKNNCLNIAG